MEGKEEDVFKLNDAQKAFADAYLTNGFNGTQAAIAAGYSEHSARFIASENLTKPNIRGYIDAQLRGAQLGPEDIKKSFSDIAKTCLNEFFTIKRTEYIPRVEIPLAVHIANLREELDFEEEFSARAGLSSQEMDSFQVDYKRQELEILRYEMKLERNPDATIIVAGPVQMIETAELDLVKIVRAKESGRIKSYVMTKEGPKIEMYAADAALRDLARIHGLFIDKVQQEHTFSNDVKDLTDEQLAIIASRGKPE